MKRGALKLNATAVARIRVGKSSGNQIGAQAQIPPVKKPKTVTAARIEPKYVVGYSIKNAKDELVCSEYELKQESLAVAFGGIDAGEIIKGEETAVDTGGPNGEEVKVEAARIKEENLRKMQGKPADEKKVGAEAKDKALREAAERRNAKRAEEQPPEDEDE